MIICLTLEVFFFKLSFCACFISVVYCNRIPVYAYLPVPYVKIKGQCLVNFERTDVEGC